MGFLHDIGGVKVGSDNFRLEFSHVLSPGSWIQVVSIDDIDTVKLRSWLIIAFLQGKMMKTLEACTEVPQHVKIHKTNYNVFLYHMPIEFYQS